MDKWYRVITKEEYNQKWRVIHDRIFSDRYPPERPFKPSHWEMFLFEGRFHDNETLFHTITPVAKQLGDRELIAFVWEVLDESIPPAGVMWDHVALREIFATEVRFAFDAHMFSQSGQWGIYSSNDHDVTYVGGEPEFMDMLASALGGRSVIRKEFFEYATNWEIREGRVAEALIESMKAIVKSVGWKWPEEGREPTQK